MNRISKVRTSNAVASTCEAFTKSSRTHTRSSTSNTPPSLPLLSALTVAASILTGGPYFPPGLLT